MQADQKEQRQRGAGMIIERCKQLAQELGVQLKEVRWKDDVKEAREAYTLVIHVDRTPDEIPLAHTELRAYATDKGTQGTDEKLKSVIRKRPSGY
jgi:hypothetical protein